MKKSHRTTIPLLCVLMCALMLCPTGCRQQASSDNGKQTREELDSLRQSFRYFNVEGQYDSIISTARPILMKALDGQDTMTVLLTGAYTAQAHLLMAQMLLLADRTQEAAAYLNDARTMIEEHQFTSLISICRLLYANMYQSNGDYFQAERNYQEAMRWGKYAEAGTATMCKR